MPPSAPARDAERERRVAALLHRRDATLSPGESTALPLVASTTFHLPEEGLGAFHYGRPDTPVWREVEAELAILEGAPCLLFPSGMAAISAALLSELSSGQRVLLPSDGYYATRLLASRVLARFGIETRECATPDMGEAPLEDIDLVFLETPSNPGLDVCDLARMAERARAAGAVTLADNTTATMLLQRPLELGIDTVIAADTKAPGGHSDVLAGHVATRDESRLARLREWRTLGGAILGPFEAWLLHRGLATFDLRLERMCRSAQALAETLVEHPAVSRLRYPGLPDDPSHAVAARQMSAFGTLVGLELADRAAADRFIARCTALAPTTSFGGVHSSAERRARWGDAVPEGFVRLSVGCEPTATLVEAVLAALDG